MSQHRLKIITAHTDPADTARPRIASEIKGGAVPVENPVAALQNRIYEHFSNPQGELHALEENNDEGFEGIVTLISRVGGITLFVGSLIALAAWIFNPG